MLPGLFFPEASLTGLQVPAFSLWPLMPFPSCTYIHRVLMCVQMSSALKGHHKDLVRAPCLWPHLTLNYLFEGYTNTEVRASTCAFWGRHNSVNNGAFSTCVADNTCSVNGGRFLFQGLEVGVVLTLQSDWDSQKCPLTSQMSKFIFLEVIPQ